MFRGAYYNMMLVEYNTRNITDRTRLVPRDSDSAFIRQKSTIHMQM